MVRGRQRTYIFEREREPERGGRRRRIYSYSMIL
jgi:hypothetical protein